MEFSASKADHIYISKAIGLKFIFCNNLSIAVAAFRGHEGQAVPGTGVAKELFCINILTASKKWGILCSILLACRPDDLGGGTRYG
jgi:hypothetical protein